jgi:Kef-type K+ transport system membrane component KefB
MKKHVILYSLFIMAAVAIVLGLLRVGERLDQGRGEHARDSRTAATSPADLRANDGANDADGWIRWTTPWRTNLREPLAVLMLQILVIMLTAGLFGAAVQRVRQPRVVGEIAAGLLLGPSLLGLVLPGVSRFLFPSASLPSLQLLSQIGITLFMFGVGLHVDAAQLRRRAHAAIAVSHISILVPFCLGTLLSLVLYRRYAGDGVTFRSFALFMGVGMSITAFPVLARIVDERRLTGTALASIALTCAAVDDVTAWTLLAFVVALVTSGGAWERFVSTLVLTVAFLLFMTCFARRTLERLLRMTGGPDGARRDQTVTVLALVFASALFTEAIGIHALFGAFVIGAVLPVDREVRDRLHDRLESLSSVILLPVFFAFTGLRTNLSLLDDVASWLVCAAIVAVATAGKLGGSMLAARVTGLNWRAAFSVGALMNTRGLMELVALNLGYELGILSPAIFAMMVVMALITTVMTGPLLEVAGIPPRIARVHAWPERSDGDVADPAS